MRKLLFLIFSFLTFWLLATDVAWSQSIESQDQAADFQKLQLEEGAAPQVQISEFAEKMRIQVGHKAAFFIQKTPTSDEIRDVFSMTSNFDPMKSFSVLTEKEKIQFQKIRRQILTKVAQVLYSSKVLTSAGVVIRDQYQMIKDIFSDEKDATDGKMVKESAKQRQVIQAFLQAIDYRLWYQAPLLLNANEFGLEVTLGGFIQAGFLKNGWTLSREIGFSFAYNKSQEALVFEIFENSESHYRSLTPMFMAGVKAKVGFTATNIDGEMKKNPQSGYSSNGFWSTFYTDYAEEHVAQGIKASLKLPPFSSMYSYTNKYERNTMVRLKISPFMFGFIHLQVGSHEVSPGKFLYSVQDFILSITHLVQRISGHTCGRVFL